MIYLPSLSMAVGPGLLQPPPLRTQLRVRVFEGGPAARGGALGGLWLPHGSSTQGLLSPGVWLLVYTSTAPAWLPELLLLAPVLGPAPGLVSPGPLPALRSGSELSGWERSGGQGSGGAA